MTQSLSIKQSKSPNELKDIYNFNVQAFADSHDFAWTEENITSELKNGWNLYSANVGDEVICAIFIKIEKDQLLTKNTPIKLNYQGNGYSHQIKDFYENYAKENNLKSVLNYCPVDNFRMISLNEGHDYHKTGNTLGDNENMVEWSKKL